MSNSPLFTQLVNIISNYQHHTDSYHHANNVPKNPPRLTLDYNSEHTSEGQLKQAVLDHSSSGLVEIIAEGMGGVGKTCALQGLATQPHIHQTFKDGLLYIKLGTDATKFTLIEQLVHLVRITGGYNLANFLSTFTVLERLIDHLVQWFKHRACLFLVDDVWRVDKIDSAFLQSLAKLSSKQSRLVYTTRDKKLSTFAQKTIKFGCKHHTLSKTILLNHAFNNPNLHLSPKNQQALQHILSVCAGHPLALALVGATIRKLAQRCINNKQNAFLRVAEKLAFKQNSFNQSSFKHSTLDHASYGRTCLIQTHHFENPFYGTINLVVDSSLKVLKTQQFPSSPLLFEKLSVLQPQQTPPLEMLHKLWNFNHMTTTEQAAEAFHNVSIIQLIDHDHGSFFHLHDLILEIALHKAGPRRQKYIQTLLDNYITSTYRQHRQWWQCHDDGFIIDNICTLLAHANYVNELLWLLSRPQWIIMRLQKGGISAVENDIQQGMLFVRKDNGKVGSHSRYLNIISQAAHMSYNFVANNSREAWFQLYGRLLWYAQNCYYTKSFVEEIERCAPRPWARSTIGFLEAAGGALTNVIQSDATVCKLVMREEHVIFLTRNSVTKYNCERGESISKFTRIPEDCIRCAELSHDHKNLVSGSRDGTVRLWDVESGDLITKLQKGHKKAVTCLAFSRDGKMIASGSRDKCVHIWDVEKRQVVDTFLHKDWVNCVAFGNNGRCIASGSDDNTVGVWNVKKGQFLNQPLQGHSNAVVSVAISSDGALIASGSRDSNIQIWDIKSGSKMTKLLKGHTSTVECVAFNREGSRIVSGSWDRSV